MPKDQILAAANRTVAEWDTRTRELKKKKMLWKQQARDRGEEIGSDNNDDNDDDDEVVADVDWDVPEREDSLTGTQSSTQGPFPFHVGGSESVRPVEAGRTIGPSSRLEDLPLHPGCW